MIITTKSTIIIIIIVVVAIVVTIIVTIVTIVIVTYNMRDVYRDRGSQARLQPHGFYYLAKGNTQPSKHIKFC